MIKRKISIVGLGYVGSEIFKRFSKKEKNVFGYDLDPEKIAKTGADGEKKEDVTKEDDKVEQVIDANVNNILNKVHKVTGDLKVQDGGNNLNTVIIPVEVLATTGSNNGGSGGGGETRPEPEVSSSLVLD